MSVIGTWLASTPKPTMSAFEFKPDVLLGRRYVS